jgi:hypothetical protein
MTASRLRSLTAASLVAVACGIWIQAFSGASDYPTVPPGPLLLVAVGWLIARTPRYWWTPLVGVALCSLITVGAFMTPGTAARLDRPNEVGPFVGTIVQIVALGLGNVVGLLAALRAYQRRGAPAAH